MAGETPAPGPPLEPPPEPSPEEILAALRRQGIAGDGPPSWTPLAGGTHGRVFALHWPAPAGRPAGAPEVGHQLRLVVKFNRPEAVEADADFLRAYADLTLLPALRYADPARRFLVCDYLPGSLLRDALPPVEKEATLLALVHGLFGRYRSAPAVNGEDAPAGPVADTFAGDVGEGSSWQAALLRHVRYRHELLAPHLPPTDGALVEALARASERRGSGPLYLLHGDCGAHNLICSGGRLSGVIDPYPAVGEPVYDLTYAFVSWPEALHPETLLPAAAALLDSGRWRPAGDWRQALREEVVIALYLRIGTCLMHHPDDLPAYLAAWPRWKGALERC